ncbi:hypothetical protein [Methylobacterium sp. Leaf118]|uniref:hypothetical protein n=1 Tax=Methylobacterium sp. Leaf118 TaxID=2876562 RepID=UPI001E4C7512|nr:hypothetical protein [Methylobacterium sp. Leaf118]
MRWYALQPRDPADPRWPLPQSPQIRLKAEDPDDARRRFHEAYPSEPFGTPGQPLPNRGAGSFRDDPDGLVVAETEAPPAPQE